MRARTIIKSSNFCLYKDGVKYDSETKLLTVTMGIALSDFQGPNFVSDKIEIRLHWAKENMNVVMVRFMQKVVERSAVGLCSTGEKRGKGERERERV